MALRIAVDLVFYTGRKGGTESYARGIFPALAAHNDLSFVGIGNKELARQRLDWFPGEIVVLPVSGENRVAWAAAEALAVGPRARGIGAHLLHCPSNFGPAVRMLPTVVTVHDLLHLRHPEWVPNGRAEGVRALSRATVRAADRIIADSQATATDVCELLGRRPADVDVVQLGVDPVDPVHPLAQAAEPVTRPYLLAGGNRMPHKNFDTLLAALATIPPAERPKLVITASSGDDPLLPIGRQLGLDGDVALRGWVSADELADLYDRATAYVFPTRFEGFGLPVLEAMARGCPVIGSDIPVLHEVGGDDMAYFDPTDPVAMAAVIRRVVTDRAELVRLAAAGRQRAAGFSWQRTADATADIYRRLAAAR